MAVSRRSLKLSSAGKAQVERALTIKGWSVEDLADAAEVGRATATNFRAVKAVDRKNFVKFCEVLGLNWESVCEKMIAPPETLKEPFDDSNNSSSSQSQVPQQSILNNVWVGGNFHVGSIVQFSTDSARDSQNLEPSGIHYDLSQPDDALIQQVREHCKQKILNQHSRMRLLSGKEIGVDQLYVYVWLLDQPEHQLYKSPESLLKTFNVEEDRLALARRIGNKEPGFEIANTCTKLLILGKPGSGKTTFLKHLAVDWCKGKFQPDLIAVLIELRRIRDGQWDLIETIGKELGLQNWEQIEELLEQSTKSKLEKNEKEQIKAFRQQVRDLLRHSKLLLLLDGLDEVPTGELRRDVQNQLKQLAEDYPNNRLILTCRTQIVGAIANLANLKSVEVDGLNEEQVKRFVLKWFEAHGKSDAEATHQWETFDRAVNHNSDLKELSMTPILLSLMCWVLQGSGEIPSKRSRLYQEGIRLLLRRWNDEKKIDGWKVGNKIYRQLSSDEKEALLIEIAARKFENPENFILFEQKEIVGYISKFLQNLTRNTGIAKLLRSADSSKFIAVLKAIEAQHGLLIERADEFWSFSHLTFQEYFTARWLNQLHVDQGLADKILDQRWQEVIKLAVESEQPADRLLRLIKQAIDQSIVHVSILQEFLNWVFQKPGFVQANYKPVTIRAFYLDLPFDYSFGYVSGFDRGLTLALDPDFNHVLDHALHLDHTLVDILAVERHRAYNLQRDLTDVVDLNRAIDLTLDIELGNQLEQLKTGLPALSMDNWESCEESWRVHSVQWIEQLRRAMIEHRNIGHRWQFTDAQAQQLIRYYAANKFLVELMQIERAVNDNVRAEIEDSMLLPWSELQRRQS